MLSTYTIAIVSKQRLEQSNSVPRWSAKLYRGQSTLVNDLNERGFRIIPSKPLKKEIQLVSVRLIQL